MCVCSNVRIKNRSQKKRLTWPSCTKMQPGFIYFSVHKSQFFGISTPVIPKDMIQELRGLGSEQLILWSDYTTKTPMVSNCFLNTCAANNQKVHAKPKKAHQWWRRLSEGKKLPTINAGLNSRKKKNKVISKTSSSKPIETDTITHMALGSRRIVNEKQHGIPLAELSSSGLLRVQLVSIAFCELSKAMAPNFSQ